MYMNWADHGGMMYKSKPGFPDINEPKILKVILATNENIDEFSNAHYQALKYSLNNQCNVEFAFNGNMYNIIFNDFFLNCKEVK